MKGIGYSDSDIVRIRNSYILKRYNDLGLYNKINDILCYLFLYGFSREELIIITRTFPTIYSYSIDIIKNKFLGLRGLGYSNEEIRMMIVKYPALFGRDIKDIKIKKNFFEKIGIGDIVVNNSHFLMQSFDLVFARYMFYRGLGIRIDHGNMNLLFMKQAAFVKKYGKTNKQLIMLYNYDEYMKKIRSKNKEKVM